LRIIYKTNHSGIGDVVEELLEEKDEAKSRAMHVRNKIVRRLSSLGNIEDNLVNLFGEIDKDGSNQLRWVEMISDNSALFI